MAKVQGPGILNQWSLHIPGCADKLEVYYQYVGEEFAKKQIPNMVPYWGQVGSTFGAKKNFWAVDYSDSTSYIGGETLGIDLYVSWLVYNPKWMKQQMKAQSATRAVFWSMFGSDIGDMLELACFAAVVDVNVKVHRIWSRKNAPSKSSSFVSAGVPRRSGAA